MNIHILIDTDSELIAYEAVALAMLLASFDHTIQLQLTTATLPLLTDPGSRIYGMIQSLPLYDMPAAWAHFSTDALDDAVAQALTQPDAPAVLDGFDSCLAFR